MYFDTSYHVLVVDTGASDYLQPVPSRGATLTRSPVDDDGYLQPQSTNSVYIDVLADEPGKSFIAAACQAAKISFNLTFSGYISLLCFSHSILACCYFLRTFKGVH